MSAHSAESKASFPADTEYLSAIIVKAMSYVNRDPEAALMYARKSAECICTDVFAREIGAPGNNRLDKLIELLSNKDVLPERVKIPLRVIQQYGNYAAHVQADRQPIDRPYIAPGLTALVHVGNWFFHDYLGIEIPPQLAASINEYEPEPATFAKEPPRLDHEAIAKELRLPSPLRSYQWEGVSFLRGSEAALPEWVSRIGRKGEQHGGQGRDLPRNRRALHDRFRNDRRKGRPFQKAGAP